MLKHYNNHNNLDLKQVMQDHQKRCPKIAEGVK